MNNLDPVGGTVVTSSQTMKNPAVSFEASMAAAARDWRERLNSRRSPEAIARGLPDDLFSADPEGRRLRALLRIEERRAKGATTELASQVGSVIPALEARQRKLRDGLEMAALDDAISGDFEFSGAVATLEEIQRLEAQSKAARLVYARLSQSPPLRAPYFAERLSHARDALATHLLQLKRAYLADHPELLAQPEAETNQTTGDQHDGA